MWCPALTGTANGVHGLPASWTRDLRSWGDGELEIERAVGASCSLKLPEAHNLSSHQLQMGLFLKICKARSWSPSMIIPLQQAKGNPPGYTLCCVSSQVTC